MDREQLWRDAFVGGWFVLGGVVAHAVYQGWVSALPTVGFLALTAVASVVAYRRGERFGDGYPEV
jgi:hypothetical protein